MAYYPRLRELTGSINATVLLCQLIYWYGKQSDSQGWVYKRSHVADDDPEGSTDSGNQSIQQETGLTYREQIVARRQLRERGFLMDRYARSEHRMYFRINFEAMNRAWEQMRSGHMPKGEMAYDQNAHGIYPTGRSLNGTYRDYAKNTAENTAESTAERAASASKKERLEQSLSEDPYERIPSTPVEAMRHPDIQLFQEVCGRIPGAAHYQTVIETMRHFREQKGEGTVEYLRPFWLAWSGRRRTSDGKPYDPGSLTWLTEWALNGTAPPSGRDEAEQRDTAEVIREVARRKNDRG